jgi:hypothetical protein
MFSNLSKSISVHVLVLIAFMGYYGRFFLTVQDSGIKPGCCRTSVVQIDGRCLHCFNALDVNRCGPAPVDSLAGKPNPGLSYVNCGGGPGISFNKSLDKTVVTSGATGIQIYPSFSEPQYDLVSLIPPDLSTSIYHPPEV